MPKLDIHSKDPIVRRYAANQIVAARRWSMAEGNRSDPFAFARAVAHVRQGICRALPNGQEGGYDATRYDETRVLPDGSEREYVVSVYRDAKRP